MSDEQKQREAEIFDQALELEELDAVAGGGKGGDMMYGNFDDDRQNCTQYEHRPMYGPSGQQFPNCAATVESGSNCWRNDGCYDSTVIYDGMKTSCGRTWE